MSRLKAIDPNHATGKAKELLDQVHAKLGLSPNLMRTMANAPAVLKGYLDFSAALAGGVLSAKLREQIALLVAEANTCHYCLSAHTALAKRIGLKSDEILDSRWGTSADPKVAAVLNFVKLVLARKGEVTDDEVRALKAAGFDDGTIAAAEANVALHIFTNYFNHIAGIEVDFPAVPAVLISTP